ncbi:MAG: hypothetical protein A2089_13265 [Elusimicrobia bacterium GWD2_63_28]|nr:MAG: hypothetical protein A2089_13265 [Elusimicrobia bacterium GWD2_63_28]
MKALLFLIFASQAAWAAGPAAPPADPYLWLEEIDGAKAIDWARARNNETLYELQTDPRYKAAYDRALAIYDSNERIPRIAMRGGYAYNFWQGPGSPKGRWRRAPLSEFLAKKAPAWEVLIDIDMLAAIEVENWVYKAASCLPPAGELCLISLSRGGKDAVVVREFDVRKKAFVEDGFRLEESKSAAAWLDANTLLLGEALSADSLTDSGYPRVVRKWARGTDPRKAPVLLEGKKSDVTAGGWCSFRPEGVNCFVVRAPSYFESEVFLIAGDKLKKMPLPPDAAVSDVFNGKLLLTLRSDWKLKDKTFKQNSLLGVGLEAAGQPEERAEPRLVFEPGPRMTVEGVSLTRDVMLLTLLDNVKGRILKVGPSIGGLHTEEVPVPPNGAAYISAASDYAGEFLFGYQNLLTPPSLYYSGKPGAPIKQEKPKFDASGFETEQREAVSADGTKIPYFLVSPKGMKRDGKNPTLLYGYGGFENSMLPYYASVTGALWLERGGVYVLANIRGGGEFGPVWHQAALKENRQKSFDDFIAVAEDLVKSGVTSPPKLGIWGGSNGGLLVGAVSTQRPELFGAVICEVPLLDMLRYTKLPPGASWVGEFGDPEDPVLGPVIAKYSPYQNVRAGVKYPAIFFLTSTKDDRVHPGHARKMAAKLKDLGHKVYYYENMDGGHSAAASNAESARRLALEYTLLMRKLMD